MLSWAVLLLIIGFVFQVTAPFIDPADAPTEDASDESINVPLPPPPTDGTSRTHPFLVAAILMPDDPLAPNICSKYVIRATYQLSPDRPALVMALSVNSDIAVPKFRSKGATRDRLTSKASLQVAFKKWEDVTGFAEFVGDLGAGRIRIVTDKAAIISGPIEDGPIVSQRFVGTGTWTMS
jgi:hypothetical protein